MYRVRMRAIRVCDMCIPWSWEIYRFVAVWLTPGVSDIPGVRRGSGDEVPTRRQGYNGWLSINRQRTRQPVKEIHLSCIIVVQF